MGRSTPPKESGNLVRWHRRDNDNLLFGASNSHIEAPFSPTLAKDAKIFPKKVRAVGSKSR
jgi:hypothetical protein